MVNAFNTSHTTIGKYDGYEMTPSIDAAKKLTKILDTSVGLFFGGESVNLFKDLVLLYQLFELDKMESTEKSHILHVLDDFIKSVKLKNIAAL